MPKQIPNDFHLTIQSTQGVEEGETRISLETFLFWLLVPPPPQKKKKVIIVNHSSIYSFSRGKLS